MITSALIAQCRRQFQDVPKSMSVSRMGNAVVNLFNVGTFPIIESSYTVRVSGVVKAEGNISGYTIDLDNGDIVFANTPGVTSLVDTKYKTAFWRDQNWNDAINTAISDLNGKGFFRQTVRDGNIFYISSGVQKYTIPSGAIDVYEVLQSDTGSISGNFSKIPVNWSWQQDSSVILLGQKPTMTRRSQISYLRNMRTYAATSATLDVASGWIELVKAKAGAIFYRSMAGRIAKQGNATINEGHLSFTNLRAMANDLDTQYEAFAKRKKPTRPAKDILNFMPAGGNA